MQLVHIFSGQTMDAKLWPCVSPKREIRKRKKHTASEFCVCVENDIQAFHLSRYVCKKYTVLMSKRSVTNVFIMKVCIYLSSPCT